MLQAGTQLHDRYRVLRRIGRGGMGAVYEAVDTRLRNTVAVKQLEIASAAADRAFEREAQLLAGLRHPVLPVVIDYFLAAHEAFLVMQYIEGEDLEHHLAREQRPCAREDVLAWAHALLDGLEYLHSRTPAIVHRDIKPANVKRTPAGDIVLLDFGLAKGRLDSDPTVSPDSGLYGFTLQYAPPEQIDGHRTDVRSDLFALGATLYHLATGAPPASALQRSMAVRSGAPDPLVTADALYPPVGRVLGAALERALRLDPAKRFASAAEMRAALSTRTAAPPRAAEPLTVERRVDAALPSQVDVGKQTDLIVQVRFAESPTLGLEDWPTKRRPDQIEQRSEALPVTHLVDAATGKLQAARVRIKVASADFNVDGDPERLIEVPVDAYSQRIAFLLTPRSAGLCRVNIEVYALDALYLGTVAVEAEALSGGVGEPALTVANVVLGSFARQAAAAPKPAVSASADTVRVKISPELAAALAEPTTPAPAQPYAASAATIVVPLPAPRPAPSMVAAPPPPVAASVPVAPVPPPLASAPPQVAEPPPLPIAAPKASVPTSRASFASRLPIFGSAAAAILIAGVVFTVWPKFSQSVSSPLPQPSYTPAPATAPAPTATAPVAAPPVAASPAASPRPSQLVPPGAPAVPAAAAPPPVSNPRAVTRPPVTAPPPPTTPRATPPPPVPPPAPVSTAPAPPPPAVVAPPPPRVAEPPPPAAPPPSAAPSPPSPVRPPSPVPPPSSAPPPSAAPPPPPAAPAPAPAPNAGGSSARSMEAAKKLEQSGELAQALAEYERARQLLELDVARLKEALQSGLVTPRRVETAEATLIEATQSVARVRARLDAQTRRKK